MAVSKATGTNPVLNYSSAGRTSITQSITVPTGAGNRVLLVFSAHEDSSGAISSITFNTSESFTKITSVNATTWSRVEAWILKNPTATTANIVATKASAGGNRWGISIFMLEGVDQTTPNDTAATNSADSGTSDTRTLSTLASGDMGFDVISVDSTGHTLTLSGTGHSSEFTTQNFGAGSNESRGGSNTDTGGAMGWTWTTSAPFSHLAVVINAAAAGGAFIPKAQQPILQAVNRAGTF